MNLCKLRKEGAVVFVDIKERDINKRSPFILMHSEKEEKVQQVKIIQPQKSYEVKLWK